MYLLHVTFFSSLYIPSFRIFRFGVPNFPSRLHFCVVNVPCRGFFLWHWELSCVMIWSMWLFVDLFADLFVPCLFFVVLMPLICTLLLSQARCHPPVPLEHFPEMTQPNPWICSAWTRCTWRQRTVEWIASRRTPVDITRYMQPKRSYQLATRIIMGMKRRRVLGVLITTPALRKKLFGFFLFFF